MKRLFFLCTLFLLVTQNVLAGPVGPLPIENQSGNVSLGAGYAFSASKWTAINRGPERIDLEQHQLFAELGLQIASRWQVLLRGGVADLSIDDGFLFDQGTDARDTFRGYGAFGLKGALINGPKLTVGPFIQGHAYSTYIDRTVGSLGAETVHLDDWWEAQAGVLFQGVVEGAVLYGGPFYYRGEVRLRRNINNTLVEETELKERGTFGALLGIRWPISKSISFDAEGQIRTSAPTLRAAFHYHF
jgi:hypothetical protein